MSTVQDFPPAEIRQILEDVTTLLKSRKETVGVVETAGGLMSVSLLTVPGASGYYAGGLSLYTLLSRLAYGGWTQEIITNYAGPTTDVVRGLAEHARKDLGSTYTIAESGTAGPTGGAAYNRTPGFVALAVACDRGTYVRELNTGLGTDRLANMKQFAVEGLKFLKEVILDEAKL